MSKPVKATPVKGLPSAYAHPDARKGLYSPNCGTVLSIYNKSSLCYTHMGAAAGLVCPRLATPTSCGLKSSRHKTREINRSISFVTPRM